MNAARQEIVLHKVDENYIFRYDEASRPELLRVFGRFAASPELSFSWYDAAVLARKVRDLAAEVKPQSGMAGRIS